ncbi:uncharacterized protein LOC101896945 [Musca domestica]|uniref:Uncharacterized protein LOC101896945 n=1 Tax=Musca domestica TaxID=7370 RepID=A0A9J7D9V3_MUSDO|nr:uncharacterized protein LOC101896945 [Musca domestica]
MNKIIGAIILGVILSQALADDPHDWYPKNPVAVHEKCREENPLTEESRNDLEKGVIHAHPDLIAFFLCTAKFMNFYTTENGFDANRLIYALEKMDLLHNRNAVEECVKKNKDVSPEETKVFNVAKCIEDKNVSGEKH